MVTKAIGRSQLNRFCTRCIIKCIADAKNITQWY